MVPDNSRQYTQDEVKEILRRALNNQTPSDSLTHQELIETARELGIDESQLVDAIEQQETVGEMEAARQEWRTRQKREFFEHLRSYLIINFVLLIVNLVTGGGWFIWPLLGWGIGVAFHASAAFFPKEHDIERGARKIVEKRRGKRYQFKSGNKVKGSLTIDSNKGKIIIEKGDKRFEIG